MIRILLMLVVALMVPQFAEAQAGPTSRFEWEMTGADILAVQAYRFELELDGVVSTLVATCAGSPIVCSAPIPAITPGTHTARIRAVDVTTPASPIPGEFSDVLTFTMRAIPSKPANFRIRQSGD